MAERKSVNRPDCGVPIALLPATGNRLKSAAVAGVGLGAAGAKTGANLGKGSGVAGEGKGWNGRVLGAAVGGAGGVLVGGVGGLLSADYAATFMVCPSSDCQSRFRLQT
ncbi:MAG: hypothetical protein AB8G14_18940 [Ilumatobacter sp.]